MYTAQQNVPTIKIILQLNIIITLLHTVLLLLSEHLLYSRLSVIHRHIYNKELYYCWKTKIRLNNILYNVTCWLLSL